jgi:EAL domain-containing protein (putative c-di-GMP-specific phosphodiesterase class I)/CheY-like chemotaxis protein
MNMINALNTTNSNNTILSGCQSNILVVDDDQFSLKMHAHLLEQIGRDSVLCFESAVKALKFVDSNPHSLDLILLDVNMPEMDGIEFVRHLVTRGFRGGIALVSGESDRLVHSIETLGREHGLTILDRAAKPLAEASLQALLEQWEDTRAGSQPTASLAYEAEDLREAIKCGDLVNYYQPQVALKDGAFLGVETLVRWHHPEDGVIPPAAFIGLAEEAGLIDDLARDVLTGSLQAARLWGAIGLQPKIAINLSAENLRDPLLTDYIASACLASELEPGRLVMEVTEGCLYRDRVAALDILARLGLKRFGLSIDDFGTGHSSLAQLQDVSFSELKIDCRFVHGAASDATRRAILEASLELAINLDMNTVAEGVENEEDWDFLRKSRCHIAQGYFVGRPMPAGKLPAWLADWNVRRETLFAQDGE